VSTTRNRNGKRIVSLINHSLPYRIERLRDAELRKWCKNLHQQNLKRHRERAADTLTIDRIERDMVKFAQLVIGRYKALVESGDAVDMVPDEHAVIQKTIDDLLKEGNQNIGNNGHPAAVALEHCGLDLTALIREHWRG
jgi:hypothetical protein